MIGRFRGKALLLGLPLALAAAACSGTQPGNTQPGAAPPTDGVAASSVASADPSAGAKGSFDSSAFGTAEISNPYLPFKPGARWRYGCVTEDGPEERTVAVTHETRQVAGVQAILVRLTASRKGQLQEEVLAAYAQDRAGNVWYLGEDVKEYGNGRLAGTKGSWQAGEDGAGAGIVMMAEPRVGDSYHQENRPGIAQDQAEVLSLSERVKVTFGGFQQVIKTKEFTPLEPDRLDHKFYARNVGLVLEEAAAGGQERCELVEMAGG
ncbi:hypothetical protein OHA25_38170 [Nonomuraea sp. NBC_00507]|uniref:hypothetical protein n=1 Tax=Nonomuraea sp. NBC_00507 TaxID=2976002 RepID=UPI002E178C9C